MQINLKEPKQVLGGSPQKQPVATENLHIFRQALAGFLNQVEAPNREGKQETDLRDFLNDAFYKNRFYINKKETIDWAIHHGKDAQSKVGVLLEVKSTTAKAEMLSQTAPNAKALHELVLYYLRERLDNQNHDIKHLIATNCHEWYIFNELWFDAHVFTAKFKKSYQDWKLSGHGTDHFYKYVAKPYIETLEKPIEFCYVNLRDYAKAPDQKLTELYKLLSPEHLLKQEIANDANKLNKPFYNELLYIIGIEERKADTSNKRIIDRLPPEKRQDGTLLENTINALRINDCLSKISNLDAFGSTEAEQLYSIGLELCITWLNRILFLKLLEAQLLRYHGGNQDQRFLHHEKIRDFDELKELFFEVLAIPAAERSKSVREKYGDIPYLNSSLFEPTDLEKTTFKISELKDRLDVAYYADTVVQNPNGKTQTGQSNTLKYLFAFLNCYDFGSEPNAPLSTGEGSGLRSKGALISASVLGLIFEKLNGYRDGSFYTPAFITMYMCRETIRRAVVAKSPPAPDGGVFLDFEDLKNRKDYLNRQQRDDWNARINSIRICDPAVGSGHFLVSALNEIIAIKAELGILQDRNGKLLDRYSISIENDELLVWDEEENAEFQYRLGKNGNLIPELQRVQETLFEEKRTIIENCLFGVDINPKSVSICQLRLWIELLKNAYYSPLTPDGGTDFTHDGNGRLPTLMTIGEKTSSPIGGGGGCLQTLPNIDINIKTGNSLVSRFSTDFQITDFKIPRLRNLFLQKFKVYSVDVLAYKECNNKAEKQRIRQRINDFKSYITDLHNGDQKEFSEILDLRRQYSEANSNFGFYADDKTKKLEDLAHKLDQQENAFATKQKIYQNAFEWRFEFPEVQDDNGNFIGFDAVIGNPPYIRQEEIKDQKASLQSNYKTYSGAADLYVFFIEKAFGILRNEGNFSYIVPNKWLQAGYGKALRNLLLQKQLLHIIDFGDLQIFDEATTYPCILALANTAPKATFKSAVLKTLDFGNDFARYAESQANPIEVANLSDETWVLANTADQALLSKLKANCVSLAEYVGKGSFRGILTGLTEAFIVDEATKEKLIAEDAASKEIIQPFVLGRQIKPYQTSNISSYLIKFNKGFTNTKRGNIDAETWLKTNYGSIYTYLKQFENKATVRTDKGDYWWELRACDYYEEFAKPKIMYQVMQVKPCFIYDDAGLFCNNSMWIIPKDDKVLLAILNSKMGWWLISKYCTAIQNGYQLIWSYFGQILIPKVTAQQAKNIIDLVDLILERKKADPSSNPHQLEAEIDALVYELYGLTDEERGIVEA